MESDGTRLCFLLPYYVRQRKGRSFCKSCHIKHRIQVLHNDRFLIYSKSTAVRHTFVPKLTIVARSIEEEYTIVEGPAFEKPPSKFIDRVFPDIRRLQSWKQDAEVEDFWKEFREEQLEYRGKSSESQERPKFIEPGNILKDYEDTEAAAVFDWINGEWKSTGSLQYSEPPSFETYVETARKLRNVLAEKLNSQEGFSEALKAKLEALDELISFSTREERIPFPAGYWRLVFLGTSSALPTRQRNVSSMALRIRCPFQLGRESGSGMAETGETDFTPEALFLVDCGEMTAKRLMEAEWHSIYGFKNLKGIFITHMHGDHVWGLAGLMEKIGFYTQHQQRYMKRIKKTPILHIFGPQGLRLFLRTVLQNTFLGFWFCVHELVPRDSDFDHVEPWYVPECLLEENQTSSTYLPFLDKLPARHNEEIVGKDVEMDEEAKCWKLYIDELFQVQVLACPIKHRVPCWGYFFKELTQTSPNYFQSERQRFTVSYGIHDWNVSSITDIIDKKYAYALGVRGKQFSRLRSGKAVKVRHRRQPVELSEVETSWKNFANRAVFNEVPVFQCKPVSGIHVNRIPRSLLLLGDTSNPSSFVEIAKHCDGLVHEATFLDVLRDKAAESFHSTAKMAGQFASSLGTRTLILTHFSSRYETNFYKSNGQVLDETCVNSAEISQDNDNEDANSLALLFAEARSSYSNGPIYLAQDYSTFDLAPHSEEVASRLQLVSTERTRKKHMKRNRKPVEFWFHETMSPAQWRKLRQNVLHCSKESLLSLFNPEEDY